MVFIELFYNNDRGTPKVINNIAKTNKQQKYSRPMIWWHDMNLFHIELCQTIYLCKTLDSYEDIARDRSLLSYSIDKMQHNTIRAVPY